MRLLSCFALLLFGLPAMATVTITGISGASSSTLPSSGTTAIIVGGTAGPDCNTSNPTGTCNSCDTSVVTPTCTTNPLCACNSARIHSNAILRITAKKDGNAAGKIRLVKSTETLGLTYTASTDDYIEVQWSVLCALANDATCVNVSSSAIALKLFADKADDNSYASATEEAVDLQVKFLGVPDNSFDVFGDATAGGSGSSDGISNFEPYPGDEKIHFRDVESSGSYPTVNGGKIKAIRVYFTEKGLDLMTPADSSSEITVDTDGAPTSKAVTGLTNDTTYVFRIALIDEANNVIQFFPANTANGGGDANCDSTNAPNFDNCPWKATPEQVLGLLTDDFNCFIATAAYGTALEPKLATFREFRWRILLQHQWGRKFVLWYYKYGSMAARYISDKPVMRAGVRVVLYPAYWFSMGSIRFGFYKTLAVTLVLLSFATTLLWISSRRIFGGR